MKVIFLDFDGVLNSEKYVSRCGKYGVVIDDTKLQLIKRLVEITNAKIVLSTSWREHWEKQTDKCDSMGIEINKIFAKYGLEIYDKTQKLGGRREREIEAYILENKDIINFVVFDDCYLNSDVIDGHFIKTSYYRNGLEEYNVEDAINILNKEKN